MGRPFRLRHVKERGKKTACLEKSFLARRFLTWTKMLHRNLSRDKEQNV